jgi:hypothetical protein
MHPEPGTARRLTADDNAAPSLPPETTMEQSIAAWLEWLDVCDAFLRAGLRREVGPDGDLEAAYRRWHVEQLEQHDRDLLRRAEILNRRAASHDSETRP